MAGLTSTQPQKPGSWFKYTEGTLDKWDSRYKCVVCDAPAFQPLVHDCGAWLCEACCCGMSTTCLICEEELEGRLKPVMAKPIVAKLLTIQVHCPVCQEIFNRESLLSHIPHCPIDCPKQCGVKVAPISQAEHEQTDCLAVLVICDLCRASVTRRSMKDMSHRQLDCPINCPNGCGENVKPRQLDDHQSTCTKVSVACCSQFCTWTGLRCGLSEHIQSCVLVKTNPVLTSLASENRRLTDQLENQARTIKGMEERSKHEMLEIMASMQQLTKQLEMLKSIQPPLRVKFTTLNGLFNTGPTIVDYVSPFQARVTLSGGIQQWVVPVTGNYKLTAIGASGGGPNGGLGAIVVTTLNLQRGQTINILVGQTGDGSWVGGGGGGTFVWENGATVQGSAAPTTNGKILVCAGGGGGAAGIRRGDPAYCKDYWSVGGKGGKGGGGCGAGWLSDGGPSEKGAGPGLTPMRGGTGGAPHPSYSGRGSGGFGGGGGCGCWDKRSGEESSTVDFGGGGGGFSGGNSNLEGGGDGGTSFIFNKNTRVGSYSRLAPAPCEGSVVFQLLPPKTLEPLFG